MSWVVYRVNIPQNHGFSEQQEAMEYARLVEAMNALKSTGKYQKLPIEKKVFIEHIFYTSITAEVFNKRKDEVIDGFNRLLKALKEHGLNSKNYNKLSAEKRVCIDYAFCTSKTLEIFLERVKGVVKVGD